MIVAERGWASNTGPRPWLTPLASTTIGQLAADDGFRLSALHSPTAIVPCASPGEHP